MKKVVKKVIIFICFISICLNVYELWPVKVSHLTKMSATETPMAMSGQWYHVPENRLLIYCCDCGLAHRWVLKTSHYGRKIYIQAWRDDDKTKIHRELTDLPFTGNKK